jgi:hypothetical protein
LLGITFLIIKNRPSLLESGSVNAFPRKRLVYENERCCLAGLCRRYIRKRVGAIKSVLYGSLWGKESIGREPPFRKELCVEVEEFPLLEAVVRERLVKTQQAGKDLGVLWCFVNCGD